MVAGRAKLTFALDDEGRAALWIQRISGTLRGFSVPSGKHGDQRPKNARARPFAVNQRPGEATRVCLLTPRQNLG